MKLSDAFYNAVNDGDVMLVRIMMEDSLLIDTTFERFDEMEKMSKNMDGLYVPHDGKEFILNKSLWTEDYMNTLMVEVINNFSHERIAHLKDVVRYLYPLPNNIIIRNNIVNRIKKELNIDISNLSISINNNDGKNEIKNTIMKEIKKII